MGPVALLHVFFLEALPPAITPVPVSAGHSASVFPICPRLIFCFYAQDVLVLAGVRFRVLLGLSPSAFFRACSALTPMRGIFFVVRDAFGSDGALIVRKDGRSWNPGVSPVRRFFTFLADFRGFRFFQ